MSRHLSAFVTAVAAVAALAATLVLGPAAHAAAPDSTDPGGRCTACRYHLNFVYINGGTSPWETTSQYAWLVAARDAVERGVSQQSGYTSIWLTDDFTQAKVDVHFCAKPAKSCTPAAHIGDVGLDRADWFDSFYEASDCRHVPDTEAEGGILGFFLTQVGFVYRNDDPSATIKSPSGNQVTETSSKHLCG